MPSNIYVYKPTPLMEKRLNELSMRFKQSKGSMRSPFPGYGYELMYKRNLKVVHYAFKNKIAEIKEQLDMGASPDCNNILGRGALHSAIKGGSVEAVKMLLENGADPNRKDYSLFAPLHMASTYPNVAIMSLLLKAGADVRQLGAKDDTPLQIIQSKLEMLQSSGRPDSRVISELECMVELLKNALQHTLAVSDVDDLMTKLSLNSETSENVNDRISKLLSELEKIKI